MQDPIPNGTQATQQLDAVIASFLKQAARRSDEAQTALFTETGKTLRLLADHPLLKQDVQFQSMLQRLAGADDMEGFHDRVIALEIYVLKVAQAHGAEINGPTGTGAHHISLTQLPDHLSDLGDNINTRTRLQVR